MTEYCSATDVSNRFTSSGYLAMGDEDGSGAMSAGEIAAAITPGIEWAGSEIDYALVNRQPPYDTATARGAANVFLRNVATDLAAWHVVSNGGRDIPESFQTAYDRAIEKLDDIREKGQAVPGLSGPDKAWDENYHDPFEIISVGET